jgi:hypothetical protein
MSLAQSLSTDDLACPERKTFADQYGSGIFFSAM